MFNKKINILFQFFFWQNSSVSINYSDFLKNEYFFFLPERKMLRYLFLFFDLSLIDIVCFNNNAHCIFKNVSNYYFFKKIHINSLNIYINIISNNSDFISMFENSEWYCREGREFFNLKFEKNIDIRNLLNNYSNKNLIFLKEKNFASFCDKKGSENRPLSKINIIL